MPSNDLTRRTLLKSTAAASFTAAAATTLAQSSPTTTPTFSSKRPPIEKRRFTSSAIERVIAETKEKIGDPELAWLFENCFPNTLDTTVSLHDGPDGKETYVITGDIHAMWLRDSSAQVYPYLPFAKEDPKLQELLAGVIRRQSKNILYDPYANAFFNDPHEHTHWETDQTQMLPGIHERKWEIDSLCYPLRLAHGYWKATGDTSPINTKTWQSAATTIIKTFREQQRKGGNNGPYTFYRANRRGPKQLEPGDPKLFGPPIEPNGLICSRFRPSDDACVYQFLIPSNFFAVHSLRQLAELAREVCNNEPLAKDAEALALEVEHALHEHAIVTHPTAGKIYAFEIDGRGNSLLMDDSNVPSLLSMPYLKACSPTDETYLRTRAFLWSPQNEWFFKGKFEGVGGPHCGKDMIWHMAYVLRAMTTTNETEILSSLQSLKATHANTGFMHESFHKDNPNKFTRSWFAWANTLFGELLLRLQQTHPHLLKQPI